MTTSWSQSPGGTLSITFRPGLVVRLIGGALLAVGLYFLLQIGRWVVAVLRPGSGGAGVGEIVFLFVALAVAAAFAIPGTLMAFFGATARVEPVPRRVFDRQGFMGFGRERATDIGEGARVVVHLHADQGASSTRSSPKTDYAVFTYKVFVEQPDADPVEIGQFSSRQGGRARQLAEAAGKTLAVPVVDRAKRAETVAPEDDRLTSEFLEKRGIEAPPKGFLVRAIGFLRLLVEALIR